MDPVSLCASILTVISAAHSVAKGLRKVKGYWQAPQLLQDVAAEIESLQSTLHQVSSFVASARSSPDIQSLCEPVSCAALSIKKINALISSPTVNILRLRDANSARVTWLCRKNEIKGLLDNLRRIRMDLIVKLGLLAASSIVRIEESLSVSAVVQSGVPQPSSTIINCPGNVNDGPRQTVLQPGQRDLSGISNTGPGKGTARDCGALQATNASSTDVLSTTTIFQSNQTCPAWCSCKCHVRYGFRSPWILDTICGRIDIQYSGQPSECNEVKCRRSAKAPFSIKYHFPRYLIKRYVAFKMYYSPLDGPTFALRAPRVIEGTSLLWHYILRGDIVAVQKLFSERKASPYDVNNKGCNGSVFAVNHHDCRVSQFLIEQGADPTLPNEIGRTASELLWDRAFAGQYGRESQSIVRSMLTDEDYMEGRNFSVLHKIVLSLVDRELRSELEISTASLNQGDATQRTPLAWAVIRNECETVELLLAYGADPNIVDDLGYSPLHFVQSQRVCEALLSAGADTSLRSTRYQKSPLHGACYNRPNAEVIDVLVEAGIPVDGHDIDNETPLMRALYESSTAEAEKFIELGANVNAVKSSSGKSPILIAVHRNLSCLLPLLLAHGADYTAVTIEGDNLAHLAAQLAEVETFKTLTELKLHGLDVELKNNNGKTPADLLAERDFFGQDATPIREAFEALVQSVRPLDSKLPTGAGIEPVSLPVSCG